MDRHACNTYCAAPEHCDLVYVERGDEAYARGQVAAAYWHRFGADVVRIEPATEAAPLAAVPPASLQPISGQPCDGYRWLVFWTLAAANV